MIQEAVLYNKGFTENSSSKALLNIGVSLDEPVQTGPKRCHSVSWCRGFYAEEIHGIMRVEMSGTINVQSSGLLARVALRCMTTPAPDGPECPGQTSVFTQEG
jgi:hypothetical protein